MKPIRFTILMGAALLLGVGPIRALPLTSPAPLKAALTPQENALIGVTLPPKLAASPLMPALDMSVPFWGMNALPWGRMADPSLRLTDWRHVFNIAALGAFDVPLRDDPAERANILLSAQAVDNVTVAPGTEFSFNAQVGERTPERGYQDGLMFDNGHVIRGTGGGICLVATGLYNAALHAGLEITERHPHSGLVSYAAPGCDAGIVYDQEDFKFRNTTARPLVIRAAPEGDHVTVRLFGHTLPPGLQVIVKPLALTTIPYMVVTKTDPALPPGQSVVDQKPRSGYDVVLARFWTQDGRVVRREIVTRERRAPRNKVVRIAPPPVVPDPLTDLLPLGLLMHPDSPAPVPPETDAPVEEDRIMKTHSAAPSVRAVSSTLSHSVVPREMLDEVQRERYGAITTSTLAAASASGRSPSGGASVISRWAVDSGQMEAKATAPSLPLSATTMTSRAQAIMARLT